MDQLRALAAQRNPAIQERIRYWDFWSPAHLWNETLIDISAANPIPGGAAMRMFAMLNVAMNDAMIAAWDTKYTYNRPRPAEFDTRFRSFVATPRSPSYPCEHSVAAGAAATVIAHIYPKEAQRVSAAAEEAARSRVMAGAAFPSDTKAGLELGRAVAGRVIERMKVDGGKWAGTVPTGPGLWKGTNPVGVDEIGWKLFVLNSPNQFRPPPPPAHDSPERARRACGSQELQAHAVHHLFPRERARYEGWAQEFGESRLWAGIHFKSDITSGWEIGRQVGEAVVSRAEFDGA